MAKAPTSFLPPVTHEDVKRAEMIAGSAPFEVKKTVASLRRFHLSKGRRFGDSIGLRMELTELSVSNKAEEPEKMEGKAVFELVVEEGASTFARDTFTLF